MALIDPQKERLRLADFYAGQMDGELEKVAGQAYELTDLALEALRAELSRRGLKAKLAEKRPLPPNRGPVPGDPPPQPAVEILPDGELDMRPLVTIRQFRDLPEALLAKGSLDSAGIECALVDENIVRLDWFWSNLMGGVKLGVDPDDVEAAEQILSQPIPEEFEAEGTGSYEQPRCPTCGSLDINFRESDPAAYLSLALSVPIPFRRRAWRCRSCGAEWEIDDAPDPEQSPS
ncbi:MAG: hypothetical protein ACXWR1_22015 [Bdellovibrionota bacterium]